MLYVIFFLTGLWIVCEDLSYTTTYSK